MAERPSIAGITAAAISLVMVAVYISLIASQGESDWNIVIVIAVLIGSAGAAAAVGSLLPYGPVRVGLLTVSAATLIVLGLIGIFSIGLPLLVAGWLATGAAIRSGAGLAQR
jgi:hypothetical protein